MESKITHHMSVTINKNALIVKDLIILQPIIRNLRGIRRGRGFKGFFQGSSRGRGIGQGGRSESTSKINDEAVLSVNKETHISTSR